jgi:hypothetical protein
MSTRKQSRLERIRSELEAVVAAEFRAHLQALPVIVLPIIAEHKSPKPRVRDSVWVAQQYQGAGR